jgi:glycosyltransferase involved in cell wall biosynthesis
MAGPDHAPEISVVIPTYRRPRGLKDIIDALAAQTLAADRFEVLVVDDCSGDETERVLKSLMDEAPFRLRSLRTPANGGPAVARNIGWQAAAAPLLAFIDDDCLPEPGWLHAGLVALQDNPRLGVLQGCTRAPSSVDIARLQGWYLWRVILQAGPFFEGCNIFYRREALAPVLGFDEEIGWWGEDTALGWKVVEAGWERGFAEDAVAVHDVEVRGWWWYLKNGYREGNVVRLAAEHPGYRAEAFWRPWAFRKEDAAFLWAVAGLLLAIRWRPAALVALPYLWWRRPSVRRPGFVRMCCQVVPVDAARAVGQLSGAVRHRILVV